MISIRARLRYFAAKFKAEPGWTFVTSEQAEIDRLLKAFGVAVADKNDHLPMMLIGMMRPATGPEPMVCRHRLRSRKRSPK